MTTTRRKRVKAAANAVEAKWEEDIRLHHASAADSATSEYERKRLARIQENFRAMEDIGLEASSICMPQPETKVIKKSNPAKRKRREKKAAAEIPKRSSRRLRGDAATLSMDSAKSDILNACNEDEKEEADSFEKLKTCEEFWKPKGVVPEFINKEGKYKSWVEEGVRERCRIGANATEAWESNGGGKFSYKNPTGKGKKSGPIKEVARKLLRKNPNMYFYRIPEPGVEHWQGDWTEEENKLFLEVAKKHGVGNKWGLFATHIPHRVGYQCSAHYRAHFVGQGIIWDDNFLFNSCGETVWNRSRGRS